jgi:hypothetical protein
LARRRFITTRDRRQVRLPSQIRELPNPPPKEVAGWRWTRVYQLESSYNSRCLDSLTLRHVLNNRLDHNWWKMSIVRTSSESENCSLRRPIIFILPQDDAYPCCRHRDCIQYSTLKFPRDSSIALTFMGKNHLTCFKHSNAARNALLLDLAEGTASVELDVKG